MELSEQLQMNLQVYANATNITVTLFDRANNEVVTYGSSQQYCTIFKEASGSRCPCEKHHIDSFAQAQKLGDAYISLCPAGLIHFIVSIFKDNSYQGSILAGPVSLDYPDMSSVDETIQKHGLSLDYRRRLYTSLQAVPLIEPFQARHLSRLLYLLISNLLAGESERREATQAKAMQQAHIGEFIRLTKDLPAQSPSQYETEKRLLNYVLSGNSEGARQLLNDMLGQIYFTSGNNIDIIKVRTIELISVLSRSIYEAGIKDETVYDMTDSFMRSLSEIHDLTDLSYHLMETLERFTNMAFSAGSSGTDVIRKAIAYMNEQYNQNPSLSDVADHIGLNPSYFSSLFKKETGMNFSAYLLRIKLDNARLLLKNSNLSLSDISAELGFESQSYFSKLFKKHTGQTPREYRQSL